MCIKPQFFEHSQLSTKPWRDYQFMQQEGIWFCRDTIKNNAMGVRIGVEYILKQRLYNFSENVFSA